MVLLLWLQLIFAIACLVALAAWFLTGRKNGTLRIFAGIFAILMGVTVFLKMLNGY